ncbi:glucosamine 6-phosphate acetyltransferase, putative [Talaromyces stipitatus ATCC 10500]|uniref:Glucosamine 6-phosphate N-acetyltransferase n=1 Tax=Talaromyces stipitatus (strain ATCC 10500 / CBS 375.48 / QM 6759 / NRRL 1006) TaxID=441959 RepID=B8M6F8_TALSN|nr:glucosamine 6-phosphate acetyltransferase, putative [Talaromyces stipitatus ATCC 10500]EED19333.1 glucosamine 6-phosphate acetyltransferase, putative [Talaromyces stipitatus ATCC 10500]
MTTDLYSVPASNGIESTNLLHIKEDVDATATNSNGTHKTTNGTIIHKPQLENGTKSAEEEEEPLFSPSLISAEIQSVLPEGYSARPLRRSDFHLGYLDVLRVLTTVGDISEAMWNERYNYLYKRNDEYYMIVICDGTGKIVGTGSLIVERKFIHTLGLVGHIEDIAVAQDQQGKKLGLRIIQTLDYVAEKVGCYKTILDCSEINEGFYIKCGFKRAGLEMAHYY